MEDRRKVLVEGLVATNGKAIRHRTHIVSSPGIVETGRISASSTHGLHAFSTPGVYGCYEIELAPLLYATPFHVTAFSGAQFEVGPTHGGSTHAPRSSSEVRRQLKEPARIPHGQLVRLCSISAQTIGLSSGAKCKSGSGYVLVRRINTLLLHWIPVLTAVGGRQEWLRSRPSTLRFRLTWVSPLRLRHRHTVEWLKHCALPECRHLPIMA